MLTEPGENELFLTATVFDEPACAAGTATAATAATAAAAAGLRVMGAPLKGRHQPRRGARVVYSAAMSLQGKTLFISGASRGIGLQIALTAARDGANVALIAKTAEPHPKLPGTVYTAAEEIEA